MKEEHIAIWVRDLDSTRQFFETYFDAKVSDRYENSKGFSSYSYVMLMVLALQL